MDAHAVSPLTARRRRADMRARRTRLALALEEKVCAGCGEAGLWRVAHTDGRVRYLVCACGRTDKIAVA